jgi:hypothetical protein
MTHRLSLAGWLAAEDGIPPQAQQFYDLSEYVRQAKEIEENEG